MKTLFAFMAALVLVAATERPAQAAASVSVEFFYDALAPYGDWVDVEGYGYCFRPTVTVSDPGWRPYTEGSWVYTDAGWTWASDEDFGWATCHYGRWFLLGGTWFWLPGETWGPAWVSWRTGDEFIGWAPLPPEATWQPDVGFNVYVDVDFNIGPACYNFIPISRFGELRLRKWLEPWQRNDDCMRVTVNHTHITHRATNDHITAVFNEGPNLDRVARLSERGIRRMQLAENADIDITDPSTRLRNWSENDRLRVIAPRVQRRGTETPPKLVRQRFDRSEVNRGWDGYRSEEVEDLRAKADKLAKRDRSKDDQAPKAEPATGPQPPPATVTAEQAPATAARDTERERKGGTSPAATAIQETPPTAPREGEATSRLRPGEADPATSKGRIRPDEPDSSSKGRTRPDSELRKVEPLTIPGRESDERTRIRPGEAEDLRKAVPVTPPGPEADSKSNGKGSVSPNQDPTRRAIPTIPESEKRLTPPERLRTEPQDAPPRSSDPKTRAGVQRPDDSPPGPPRTIRPESSGATQRPLPKVKQPERPKQDELPMVRPERTQPGTPPPQRVTPPPQQQEIKPLPEARRVEPLPQQFPKAETPRPTPLPQAVEHPPQPGNRPSVGPPPASIGGKKGTTEEEEKKDKRR